MRLSQFYKQVMLVLTLILSACVTPEEAPVVTLQSDKFTVEILTPEGVFKHGKNNIKLHVITGEESVSFEGAHLVFTMPHAGGESYMEIPVDFSEPSVPGLRAGQVEFDMPGLWKGQLHIEVPDDIIALTFEVDVVETL